jgi:hypothetical protein
MRPLDPDLQREWLRRMPDRRRRTCAPPHPDRRRSPRFPVANTEIGNHGISGKVLDLGPGGMAIEAGEALRPGRQYTLTLTIGEHVESVAARVLWCRLSATRRLPGGDVIPVYRAGIERARPDPGPDPGPEPEPEGR